MIDESAPRAIRGDVTPRVATRGTSLLIAIGQAIFIAGMLYFVFLDGWRRNLSVPLQFSSDSLLALMQSKSTIDNGWWWSNPMLGAPFALDQLAYPANSNVDQAIVWLAGGMIASPAAAVNLAWAAIVVLSGIFASWCMRALGISRTSAIVAGTLFALSPYALYRNIDHFWMVIYLVPFPCAVALLLASGRIGDRFATSGSGIALLAGCALLGFNYVYYAFFACFLLALATAIGWLTSRRTRLAAIGALAVGLIAGTTALNLAPSLYSWSLQGRPLILRDKAPAESEVYGLKIRHLVSPGFLHRFPPFRAWTSKESAAQFPLETENMTSRLGLVGTIGFLALLALLLVPGEAHRFGDQRLLQSASGLTIAAVLLATIGGFGSLFSLLVTPEIRAYNRICPFIEFFALVAVALALDSLFRSRRARTIAAALTLGLGLADQRTAALPLNLSYAGIASEIPPLETFVRRLETRLPPGAKVLQLPFRTYMNDDGVARMKAYDHLKLYMMSRHIHWSYPALSNEQVRWQQAAARLDPRQLPRQLAAEGFAAIVVDRYGYADNGSAIAADLGAALGTHDPIAQTDRYLALDIRALAGIEEAAVPRLSTSPSLVSEGLIACGDPPLMNIDRVGVHTAPFDGAPLPIRTTGELKISGWAVDQVSRSAAAGVDVVVDQTLFPTLYGSDRNDVVDYFKSPGYRASGFIAAIPAGEIGRGAHSLGLRIAAKERRCYYQTAPLPIVVE